MLLGWIMLFWGLKKDNEEKVLLKDIFIKTFFVHFFVLLVYFLITFLFSSRTIFISSGKRKSGYTSVRFSLRSGHSGQSKVSAPPITPEPVAAPTKSPPIHTKHEVGPRVGALTKLPKRKKVDQAEPKTGAMTKLVKPVVKEELPVKPVVEPQPVPAQPPQEVAQEQETSVQEINLSDTQYGTWQDQIKQQMKENLVLPPGFEKHEQLSVTVYINKAGKAEITKEHGCDIPVVRAAARRMLLSFDYPKLMWNSYSTFIIG